MFTWTVAVIVLLALLWLLAWPVAAALMHSDDVAMRDYQAQRDAFEDYFE